MRFKSWKRNERVVMERNPDYWGRPIYFNRIVYRCVPNSNTMTQLDLQNELDFSAIPDKDRYLQCKKDPAVTSGKVVLSEHDYPGYRYIGYNMKRANFSRTNAFGRPSPEPCPCSRSSTTS